MEEEKAAALYDELTRKGGGAARFKQGLGFSSISGDGAAVPARGSALPTATSSSSFLSQFVKASGPSSAAPEVDKQAQLSSVQNKLKKKPQKPQSESDSRRSSHRSRSRSPSRDRNRSSRRRSRSRSPSRDRNRSSRRWIRSRSPSRDQHRSSRRRSRNRSQSRHSRRSRSKSRDRDEHYRGERRRRRSRSESPRRQRNGDDDNRRRIEEVDKGKRGKVDYAKLIEGYDKMTAAERVKAKMKLQLTETAEKDEKKGMGSGWERFEFNKDAPLDDEEEIETVEDDAALVKHIGQTFRFSAVEAKREQALKDAHDEAMFGAPSVSSPAGTGEEEEEEDENIEKQTRESAPASLLSDQVLGMQKVSWRDRVPRSS